MQGPQVLPTTELARVAVFAAQPERLGMEDPRPHPLGSEVEKQILTRSGKHQYSQHLEG